MEIENQIKIRKKLKWQKKLFTKKPLPKDELIKSVERR